jgi:hypothetical protein
MKGVTAVFADISEQLEAMSTRDRNLATGLAAGLVLLLAGAMTWSLQSMIADHASRVVLAKQNLMSVREMALEYEDLQARLAAAEEGMGAFQADSMSTYLDTWAAQAGVSLRNVQETDAAVVGNFKERDFRVEVERAELGGVLQFLHAIETSPYLIKVRSANFKVKEVKRERTIDLDLDLRTFSKEDS